jgi:hypothetical protein
MLTCLTLVRIIIEIPKLSLVSIDASASYKQNVDQLLCNETNRIVNSVYNDALLNSSESTFWQQDAPFSVLNCKQLIRSIPSHIMFEDHTMNMSDSMSMSRSRSMSASTNTIANSKKQELFDLSLQRLAEKLKKLDQHQSSSPLSPSFNPLKIVVIGGSMTTGFTDFGRYTGNNVDPRYGAWPRKLEQFMRRKWNTTSSHSVQVVNLAQGGADENTWLGQLDVVMNYAPFDVILVESAVNDQCNYNDQESKEEEVNLKSDSLLNTLMNFPNEPAVLSVELFRTASTNKRDANMHCRGYVEVVNNHTGGKECTYCPQWWKPQDWRKKARERNSVSYISYRDAVWPILNEPPKNLCYQYWNGLSHPQTGTHTLVASTILFQFMAVIHRTDELLGLLEDGRHTGNDKVELISPPKTVCLNPISSYRAIQNDPTNPMDVEDENKNKERNKMMGKGGGNDDYIDSCWEFRADVKQKYGWICEYSSNVTMNGTEAAVIDENNVQKHLHFAQNIRIGGDQKVIISRLVSYDDRMATAQVWFSHGINSATPNENSEINTNIFVGDPIWNITSWHKDRTSIPQPVVIELDALETKNTTNTTSFSMQRPASLSIQTDNVRKEGLNAEFIKSSTFEVTFNMRLLVGSSIGNQNSAIHAEKFKLLGIVSC